MNSRLAQLYLERGQLLERIATQRQNLAVQLKPIRIFLDWPGRAAQLAKNALSHLRQNPATTSALVAALLVLKPGFVWRWAKRSFFVWRSWSAVRGSLSKFSRFL